MVVGEILDRINNHFDDNGNKVYTEAVKIGWIDAAQKDLANRLPVELLQKLVATETQNIVRSNTGSQMYPLPQNFLKMVEVLYNSIPCKALSLRQRMLLGKNMDYSPTEKEPMGVLRGNKVEIFPSKGETQFYWNGEYYPTEVGWEWLEDHNDGYVKDDVTKTLNLTTTAQRYSVMWDRDDIPFTAKWVIEFKITMPINELKDDSGTVLQIASESGQDVWVSIATYLDDPNRVILWIRCRNGSGSGFIDNAVLCAAGDQIIVKISRDNDTTTTTNVKNITRGTEQTFVNIFTPYIPLASSVGFGLSTSFGGIKNLKWHYLRILPTINIITDDTIKWVEIIYVAMPAKLLLATDTIQLDDYAEMITNYATAQGYARDGQPEAERYLNMYIGTIAELLGVK